MSRKIPGNSVCILAVNKSRPVHSVLLVLSFLFLAGFSLLTAGRPDAAHATASQTIPLLDLRVDGNNRVRAFCNGIQAIVSFVDFLEFYQHNLNGSRKRIFVGPRGGTLRENFPGMFTLTGNDQASGSGYTIVFKQIDSSTIELFLTFKAPSIPVNIDFGIMKLSGDLFKGASIEASPAALTDANGIPVQPLPVAKRMLLTGKNRVLFKAALC
ncbi:MAG: hypothetical protein KJ714_06615, partial [Euryarchaeota archaeon]|nr:hypothetical protein [Euryarchaeota archaeon]